MRFGSVVHLLSAVAGFSSLRYGEAANSVANENCSTLTNPIWKETIGNEKDFPYDEDAVTITGQYVDEVTFTVTQIWAEEGVPMVSVHYRTTDGDETCSMETNDGVTLIPYGFTKDYTAQCFHGYAEIAVYTYVGDNADFDIDECEGCSAPDNNYVGYYMSIPCIPVCEPVPADCFSDPVVHLADIGHEQACIYSENPLIAEATSKKTNSVEFTIANTWLDDLSAVSVYYTNVNGEPECNVLENMEGFTETAPFEAFCEDGVAEVIVQVHSNDIAHIAQNIPDACNTPSGMGTCSYEYIVPCVPGEMCAT